MADLNLSVKIGAEDIASGPLNKVAGELANIERQARLAGGEGGGQLAPFTVNVTRAAEASATAAKAHGEHGKALGFLGEQFKDVTRLVAGFTVGALAVEGIQRAFEGLSDSVVNFNAHLEQSQVAWTTFLGSPGAATSMIGQLEAFAGRTPFRFEGLEDSARLLTAMGVSSRDVLPLLTDIGNAVSATGRGAEGMQRVAYVLGEMESLGRVDARIMRELTIDGGIPAWNLLAASMGKSVEETRKLAEAGDITSATFFKAFHEFVSANWGDMMAKQAQTFNGALSTLEDNLQLAAAEGFRPLFESVRDTTVEMAKLSQTGSLSAWSKDVAASLDSVLPTLRDIGSTIGTINKFMSTPINYVAPAVATTRLGQGGLTEDDRRALIGRQDDVEQMLRLDQSLQASYAEAHNLDGAMVEVHADFSKVASLVQSTAVPALNDADTKMTSLGEHAARLSQMLGDQVHRWDDDAGAVRGYAAALASLPTVLWGTSNAQDELNEKTRAHAEARADQKAKFKEYTDDQAIIAETMRREAEAARRAAEATAGIGQSALVAIAGLSALDMTIAETSQELAGVQLQIEEKVLARMERRPAVTLGQQEALLSERLKVEQLEKAAGFTVSQEALKIDNAQARAARQAARLPHHAGGADWIVGGTGGPDSQYVQFMASPDERVTVTPSGQTGGSVSFASLFGAGSIVVQTASDAARVGAMVEAKLNDIIAGAGLSNGRANRQLAGVR